MLWQREFFDHVLRSNESYSEMELPSGQSGARWIGFRSGGIENTPARLKR